MSKVLFIDGQVFQSVAWDRGMGKYSLAMMEATLKSKGYDYDKTYIIFTDSMPLDPAAKKLISQATPSAKHIFCGVKTPDDPSTADIPAMQQANESILEAVIAKSIKQGDTCDFLILSLFIDQVSSVFPPSCRKILLFYDLIPLQYNERYGLLASYNNYLARYKTLFEADIILTISQTVADDVALNLGIAQHKIFNINGAPIARMTAHAKKPKLDVPSKFVLMPSGDDIRKNNVRAVQGFEAYLRATQDSETMLVITSFFTQPTRETLKTYSSRIIFTGNVAEEELRWLYLNAKALLFVPEYEGLGLPILEAAEVDKPIVCSNLTVFNEISQTAFYYSDPFDPFSIAAALKDALGGVPAEDKIAEYPAILARYTWENTASAALDALSQTDPEPAPHLQRLKLAVLTPTPSGYSAIGKLVMQLHPAMEQYFEIDYYVETGKTYKDFSRPNYLPYISKVYPVEDFNHKKYQKYDAVLYHVGNSEFHVEIIKNALHLPGYAIFHDTHLTDVFEGPLSIYGYITEDRLRAEAVLDKKIPNPKATYISSIVNNQLGLVAHSDYVKAAVAASSLKEGQVCKVNLPTAVPDQLSPKNPQAPITIGLAGIIHPAKGLDIIEELARLDEFFGCNIHIFGLSLVSDEVISRLEAYPNVQVDTNVTDFQFQSMLGQLDILINYRAEYRGETSLATIEAMRFGVIPIVRSTGWYDELPDGAVVKVRTQADLIAELKTFIADPKRLDAMKQAAREYIRGEHSYNSYASKLYDYMSVVPKAGGKELKLAAAIRSGASLSALKKLLQGSS